MAACTCSSPAPTYIFSTLIGSTTPTQFGFTLHGQEMSPDIEVDDNYLYIWQLGATYNGPQVSQVYAPFLMQYSLSAPLSDYAVPMGSYFIENNVTYELTSYYTTMPGLTKHGTTIFGNTNLGVTSGGFLTPGGNNLIFKVQGGTTTRLTRTSSIGLTSNFAADASNVYIDAQKISVNGGSMSYWTNHSLATPSTLTIDGSYAYFGSYGYWNDTPYSGTPDVALNALFKVSK